MKCQILHTILTFFDVPIRNKKYYVAVVTTVKLVCNNCKIKTDKIGDFSFKYTRYNEFDDNSTVKLYIVFINFISYLIYLFCCGDMQLVHF